MLRRLVQTDEDYTLTLLRIVLGVVMFAHGSQKMLGWFGGPGFSTTLGMFTGTGMPAAVAVLVIAAEFFGSLGLIFGFLGRVGALGITAVMLGAVALVHGKNGFFMNNNGYEYHLLALALSIGVLWRGSGALSVDRLLTTRLGVDTSARPWPHAA